MTNSNTSSAWGCQVKSSLDLAWSRARLTWARPAMSDGPKASSAASTRGPHAHPRRHSSEMPSGDPRRGSRGWSWKRSCARPSPAPATLRRLILMQSEAHAVVCASTSTCHCARSEEHTGCVNTLSWNESGSLLISGSDDCRVCVWDCGGGGTPTLRRAVKTGHRRNIFSALFLPGTADQQVVTCALDRTVQHVDLMTGESTRLATCAQFCSKLALVPGCAHAFLSAGVDGRASLFDLREGQRTRRIAVDLNAVGGCTGLAFDPTSGGYHFALGCDDPITRVYDLRAVRFDKPDASRVLHQYVPRQYAPSPPHTLKPIPSSPYPHLSNTCRDSAPNTAPQAHRLMPIPSPVQYPTCPTYPHLPHTLTCPKPHLPHIRAPRPHKTPHKTPHTLIMCPPLPRTTLGCSLLPPSRSRRSRINDTLAGGASSLAYSATGELLINMRSPRTPALDSSAHYGALPFPQESSLSTCAGARCTVSSRPLPCMQVLTTAPSLPHRCTVSRRSRERLRQRRSSPWR